jgi:hypothetical protein
LTSENDVEKLGLASRRRYLQTVGSVAAITLGGAGVAAAGSKSVPALYRERGAQSGSPTSDVFLTHVSELPSVKRRLSSYERRRHVEDVVSTQLRRTLAKNRSATVDVTVETAGERTSVTTRGQFGRRIHGWRPTSEEIAELSEFGDVSYVPEVISTKVGLGGVRAADVAKIASLEFVLGVGDDPALEPIAAGDTGVSVQAESRPTADELKSSAHMGFDSAVYDLTPLTQIGIIGGGYTGVTDWSRPWAASIGIDTTKARDFIGDDWRTGTKHGTNVADTAAYVLKDGACHPNLFVPLQVYEPDYGLVRGSVMRSAIEYALLHDVAVVNISVETAEYESHCPSTVCAELYAYTAAGYLAVVASGNDSRKRKVCHPATSHFSVTAGGYSGRCVGGYYRHGRSNYGQINYWDTESNTVSCPWCYESAGATEFQPTVYACYAFTTDAGNAIGGTSFAAPLVAAAGAIRHAVHGSDGFAEKLADFSGMDDKTVCESDASRRGQILHVPALTATATADAGQ